MMELTPKQARFVEEFLLDFNATQAAIRAGYSKKSARQVGAANMSKAAISANVKRRTLETGKRLEAKRERVLEELVRLALSDIRTVVKWKTEADESGQERQVVSLTDSDAITDDAAAAIAEVRQTRNGLVVKLRDKLPALQALARHLGLDQPEEDEQPRRIEICWGPPREPESDDVTELEAAA
jgi:phage terminase small subunit